MNLDTTEDPPLQRALGLGAALIAGMFIVVRPVANQFQFYSGETAFAGLLVTMFLGIVGLRTLLRKDTRIPWVLIAVILLWLALQGMGLWRSPHAGVGLGQACDAAVYALLLLCGYLCIHSERALKNILSRAAIAMCTVEAFAGIWQRYVDLPMLWAQVKKGQMSLPESLQSTVGQYRLYGDDVFATFGNPNSLAAFLLVGIFLLAGIARGVLPELKSAPLRMMTHIRLVLCGGIMAMMLWALVLTNSKGGLAALAIGAWFFAAQEMAGHWPGLKRLLVWSSALMLGLMIAALTLAALGKLGANPFGRSIQVRIEYWKAAWGMIRDHPLTGTGLGGFMENYCFYKTIAGTEVKEAHNDYLQLWSQLGLFGLLCYAGFWALILPGDSKQSVAPLPNRARSNELDVMTLAGGCTGFLMLYVAFRSFNSGEAANVFAKFDTQSFQAMLHSLALPVVFVCIAKGLDAAPLTDSNAQGEVERAWANGYRAATGAVLVHQMVDFDFTCQAVMCPLFFFGGMLCGRCTKENAPGISSRVTGFILVALSIFIFWESAYIPFYSGIPRQNAEDTISEAQDRARELASNAKNPSTDETYRKLMEEVVHDRIAAANAAPFDGDAWIELAIASQSANQPLKQIIDCLQKAEQCRPLAWVPKAMLGNIYFDAAFKERKLFNDESKFNAALAEYTAASERYPYALGVRLWKGDVLLVTGHADEAAREYDQTFKIDMKLVDNNIRLSGIFYDPKAGAFSRHGHEDGVYAALDKAIPSTKPEVRKGLWLRRLVASAFLYRERLRLHVHGVETDKLKAEVVSNAKTLMSATSDIAERAHCALFVALANTMTGDPQKAAWTEAKTLQTESEAQGNPGSPHGLIEILEEQTASKRQFEVRSGRDGTQ